MPTVTMAYLPPASKDYLSVPLARVPKMANGMPNFWSLLPPNTLSFNSLPTVGTFMVNTIAYVLKKAHAGPESLASLQMKYEKLPKQEVFIEEDIADDTILKVFYTSDTGIVTYDGVATALIDNRSAIEGLLSVEEKMRLEAQLAERPLYWERVKLRQRLERDAEIHLAYGIPEPAMPGAVLSTSTSTTGTSDRHRVL